MAKYKVVQNVEINGEQRKIGSILDETEFSQADAGMVFVVNDPPEGVELNVFRRENAALITAESAQVGSWQPAPKELQSLLRSGHIVEVIE